MKTTPRRRTAAALTALATLATLALTSCSSGAEATSGPITELSIMAPYLSTNAPSEGNDIEAALEKQIGTKLKISWVPNSSYGDKTNITLAGDDIPMVMVVQSKSAGFVKNAKAGAFWDLTDYLKDYPNLTTENPAVQEASSVNGKVYGIYRARDVMRTSVTIRKDWLDKLGLEMPKTTADLEKIAAAFTNDDPDGNGQKDTYGLIIPKWEGIGTNSPYDAIETWYGAGNTWTEADGKLVPNFTTEAWLNAVDYEKNLITSGYVNPDFATLDGVNWNEPFLNGKGGIIIDTYSRSASIMSLLKDSQPDTWQTMVDFTGNLEGPDGKLRALPTAGYSGFLAIPKAQIRTEAQLREVLSILDKMSSPEAQRIENNGIEGVHYTLNGDQAVPVEGVSKAEKDIISGYAQLGTNVAGYHGYTPEQPTPFEQTMFDKREGLMASDEKVAVYNPAAAFVSDTYVAKGAQLDVIITDARLKYLAGQITKEQLQAEIARWRASGGDQVISEINALAGTTK